MARRGDEKAPGLRSRVLLRSAVVTVRDVQCQPETLACSCEECSTEHQLVFPRRGAFVVHHGAERSVIDANHVLFFTAWRTHRVSHLNLEGDACTVLRFDEAVLDEAVRDHGRAAGAAPFPRSHSLIDASAALESRSLFAGLTMGQADALAVEEASLRLLCGALWSAGAAATRSRRQDRISRSVQECLADRPFERWSLTDLGAAAGASPYHLARSFRATVGLPIHQYQLRLRLAAGLNRVLAGCEDFTGLALDLGFSSHSHFTAAFHRAFGLTPWPVRAGIDRDRLARLRKISTAGQRSLA